MYYDSFNVVATPMRSTRASQGNLRHNTDILVSKGIFSYITGARSLPPPKHGRAKRKLKMFCPPSLYIPGHMYV